MLTHQQIIPALQVALKRRRKKDANAWICKPCMVIVPKDKCRYCSRWFCKKCKKSEINIFCTCKNWFCDNCESINEGGVICQICWNWYNYMPLK